MSDNRVLSGLAEANTNGGYYHPGKEYDFSKKLHVWDCFISLLFQLHPQQPSIAKVAREAKVSWDFAKKVVEEVKKTDVSSTQQSTMMGTTDTTGGPSLPMRSQFSSLLFEWRIHIDPILSTLSNCSGSMEKLFPLP